MTSPKTRAKKRTKKRIVILCDGTWNRTDTKDPTNVVKTAQAMLPFDPEGVPQIPIYVRGVGSAEHSNGLSRFVDRTLGGALGWGLMQNMVEAYRQLVFLYEPGDEVYIFGFSRGAYTARTLTGLIRSSGIVSRDNLDLVPKAVARYRKRGDDTLIPSSDDSHAFRAKELKSKVATSTGELHWRTKTRVTQVPLFQVQFLGVWDTVGALGVPARFEILSKIFNRKYLFHDTKLSSMVLSARHAVAIDEHRAAFLPTVWGNIEKLNTDTKLSDRPFREEYFAGDHGSVGGGGDIVGLSNIALTWILEGAQARGLAFDTGRLDALKTESDPINTSLTNFSEKRTGIGNLITRIGPINRPGPADVQDVHRSAKLRWCDTSVRDLPERYKPKTLQNVENDLLAWCKHNDQGAQDTLS